MVCLDKSNVSQVGAYDFKVTQWVGAIVQIANHYRLDVSEQNILSEALWDKKQCIDIIPKLAKQADLDMRLDEISKFSINKWTFPFIIEMKDGNIAIAKSLESNGDLLLSFMSDNGLVTVVPKVDIVSSGCKVVILRPAIKNIDPRLSDYINEVERDWIWKIIFGNYKPYLYIALASLFINALGLAGITFSMQVYDRIIPAQSYPTMWVLFFGVIIAFSFDYVLRVLRYSVIDILGKRADLKISDNIFGHSLRINNGHKPLSTGSFISQLREVEHVREMITSSTVVAIADFPFFFMFLFVIYLLGGAVFVVPLIGFLLMVLPGILCQKKLASLARANTKESNLRSTMLVEAIQGLADIKSLQAEYRFQQQWLHYTSTSARSSLELKSLTHRLSNWAYLVQNAVFVCVILVGIPLVIEGELSTGALVACSILSSRMMAPVSQVASILTRWQQAKVAIAGIDSIMALPTDYREGEKKVHKSNIVGDYFVQNASFKHNVMSSSASVIVNELNIRAGEKIALLGRNGSGKSSFLSALAGDMICDKGVITLDKIKMESIDPTDLRRDVGYLSQRSRLFYGSIRDNVSLGMPLVSDEEIYSALELTGAMSFVNRLPNGLDHLLLEGGAGLSGGQLQALLLSRVLLRNPNVILLDEPTASLDEFSEKKFVDNMGNWLEGKTLIVATHRKKVLEMVDRIIVLSDGNVVMDKRKDDLGEKT